jgi:hypothetical protein
MDILHQMHAIFNNNMVIHKNKKKVTFTQPIPEQRVAMAVTIPSKAEMPIVRNTPRVTSAVIDKPIEQPTTHTSVVKTCSTSRIEATVQTDFAAAVTIMEKKLMSESSYEKTNANFDAKTNQLLKYQKLITHPDYQVACNRSSSNKLGRLTKVSATV